MKRYILALCALSGIFVFASAKAADVDYVGYPMVPVGDSIGNYRNESGFLADYYSESCAVKKKHLGEDWNEVTSNPSSDPEVGDPIYTIANGKVVYIRNTSTVDTYGKMVIIEHTLPSSQKIYSVYMHLKDVYVSDGASVTRTANTASSTVIGTVGTANGTYVGKAHLHFEIRLEMKIPQGSNDTERFDDIAAHHNPYVKDLDDTRILNYVHPTHFIQSYQNGKEWLASVPLKTGWNRVRWQYASALNLNSDIAIVEGGNIHSLSVAASNGLISNVVYERKLTGEWKQFSLLQTLVQHPEKHIWIYTKKEGLVLAVHSSGWRKFQKYDIAKVNSKKLFPGCVLESRTLNMRTSPGTSASIVKTLNDGDVVAILGENEVVEGMRWWRAITGDGTQGWVVQNWLEYTPLMTYAPPPSEVTEQPLAVGGCSDCVIDEPSAPPSSGGTNPSATAPSVNTLSPTEITITTARLRGEVNPNGWSTVYWFQWGLTTAYGNETTHLSIGAGTTTSLVTFGISGLSCSTTYHARFVAENPAGIVYGNDGAFQAEGCGLYTTTDALITVVTTNTLTFVWKDTSINEEAFKIERRTPGNTVFEHRYYQYPNMESWTDQWPPIPVGEICYRVKAIRSGVPDPEYSNIACAIVPPPPTVIYSDSLASGWGDWSWSTSTSHGARLSATYQAQWAGVHLHATMSGGVSTVGHSVLSFVINGGATGGQNLIVHVHDQNGAAIGSVYVNTYVPGGLQPNTDHQVNIPLSALNAVDKSLDRVIIQNAGSAPTTVTFDNIEIGQGLFTPPSPLPPPPEPSEYVYSDSLGSKWGDWSWSTTTAHGTVLTANYQSQWAGLHLHVTSGTVSTVGKSKLEFTVNGGSTGGQNLIVLLYDQNGATLGSVYLNAYVSGGALLPNFDHQVSIPLLALNAVDKTLDRIIIQHTQAGSTTVMFDNIRFSP